MDPTATNSAFNFVSAVTQLTACRNQGELDCGLIELLRRAVAAREIQVSRCVGVPPDLRLLPAAEWRLGSAVRQVGCSAALDELPKLLGDPLFAAAALDGSAAHEATLRYALTVKGDSACIALVELQAAAPLEPGRIELLRSLLGVYRNLSILLDIGHTDALTGLLNRKTYDASFHRVAVPGGEATEGGDRRSPAGNRWMAVIDIDFFKRVNDQHGHLIGDELLLLFGQLMRNTFRFGDSLYRFGGEEFVVLLSAPDRTHACSALERFRARLKAQEFPQVGHITASIGFTQIREYDFPSNAFDRADRAVYHAKQNGRDQVRCFEDLTDAGLTESQERVGELELF